MGERSESTLFPIQAIWKPSIQSPWDARAQNKPARENPAEKKSFQC
jgi:hypothetical protein